MIEDRVEKGRDGVPAAENGSPESAPAPAAEDRRDGRPAPPAGDDRAEAGGPADLAAELEAARREAAEHHEALLRARAELENLRRRAARDVENAHRYALERFMAELLPVKDSLELGLAAAGGEDVDPVRVREGIELTLKMLETAVAKFGLEVVDPLGEPFDPELHQAMSVQEVEGKESGTVLNVVQRGYRLNDRLIRPAMVIVAK